MNHQPLIFFFAFKTQLYMKGEVKMIYNILGLIIAKYYQEAKRWLEIIAGELEERIKL